MNNDVPASGEPIIIDIAPQPEPEMIFPDTSDLTISMSSNSNPQLPKKTSVILESLKKWMWKFLSSIKSTLLWYFILSIYLLFLMKTGKILPEICIFLWVAMSIWFVCLKTTELLRNQRRAFVYRMFTSDRNSNNIVGNSNNINALNIFLQNNVNRPHPQIVVDSHQSLNDVFPRLNSPNIPNLNENRLGVMFDRLMILHNRLNSLLHLRDMTNRPNTFRNLLFSNDHHAQLFRQFFLEPNLNNLQNRRNGFNEQELELLPRFIYHKEKLEQEDEQCCICLMEYKEEEELKTLPCVHSFHSGCIDGWLKREKSCPLCKAEVALN